jgi:hypothetical protein
MQPIEPRPAYRTFLVTVWQEPNSAVEQSERWRFRMEDPHTNQRRVFANPQALIVALKEGTLASEPVVSDRAICQTTPQTMQMSPKS